MLRSRRGSLTVEAVLILPIFMAAILFVSYFIKAHMVHDMVQDALTEAVMEVSALSYPYYLSGALEFKETVSAEKAARMETLQSCFGTVMTLIESTHGPSESLGLPEEALDTALGEVTPQSMFDLAKLTAAAYGINQAEDAIARRLILSTMGRILAQGNRSLLDRMDTLGIQGGMDGFDFTGSVFYGEDDVIDVQVQYTLKKMDPFGFVQNVPMRNRVVCRAWMGGVDIDGDGGYKRVTVPAKMAVDSEDEDEQIHRTCYILTESQTSERYHHEDCPNLRVRGDTTQWKPVTSVQVTFQNENGKWVPVTPVEYRNRTYSLCGSCEAGIIRMKN